MSRPTSSRSSPAATAVDLLLPDPPRGTVSAVVFSPTPAAPHINILASSWDHRVHHYRINSSVSDSASTSASDQDLVTKVQTFAHEAPVLDVCFITDTLAASASVDRRVRLLDLQTGKTLILGKHEDSLLKLRWCPQTQLLVSGSADRKLSFWNVSLEDPTKAGLFKTLDMPDKVIALDISPPFPLANGDSTPIYSASAPGKPHPRDPTPRLVVGMTGRHVFVYDLLPLHSAIDREQAGERVAERDWQPDQKRESSLKFMARDLRCMPSGDGYATSSIEGRIAVEFFDPNPKVQAMKYAFKCHRETVSEGADPLVVGVVEGEEEMETPYDVVYPVHGIAFHPKHGTFASLGGDAVISVWDAAAKKRIRQYPKLTSPITAGTFDPSGTMLLVATGSDSIDAKEGDGSVSLVLKRNVWEECKPKIKSSSSSSSKAKK
ncbi:related to mitotic checkpoint protein BUB3 [Ustilago sp. UG-2017a]|nr:related to mitotic checkpoint protein BUB3 [Ustilago sp. UG-2017a]